MYCHQFQLPCSILIAYHGVDQLSPLNSTTNGIDASCYQENEGKTCTSLGSPRLLEINCLHHDKPQTQTSQEPLPTQILIFQGPTLLHSLARSYTTKLHHFLVLLTRFYTFYVGSRICGLRNPQFTILTNNSYVIILKVTTTPLMSSFINILLCQQLWLPPQKQPHSIFG